jgi:hypothetical protein
VDWCACVAWLRGRGEQLTVVLHDVKPVSDDPPPVGVLQLPIGDCNHNSIAPPFVFWGPLRLPLHLCSAAPAEVRERGRKGEREKGQRSHLGIIVLPEILQVGRGPHALARRVCARAAKEKTQTWTSEPKLNRKLTQTSRNGIAPLSGEE